MSSFQQKFQYNFIDYLYFVFEKKMLKIMDGVDPIDSISEFVDTYYDPQWDLENLKPLHRRAIENELKMSFNDSFIDYFQPESLEWLLEEENIDHLVELMNSDPSTNIRKLYSYKKVPLDSLPANITEETTASEPPSTTRFGRLFGITRSNTILYSWETNNNSELMSIYSIITALLIKEYWDSMETFLDTFIAQQTAVLK